MCAARILIADDHDIVRKGLRALVQEEPSWQIVADVQDGRNAVVKTLELKPHVAILDIGMPSLNGLDATKQIVKVNPDTRVLIHDA